MRKSSSWKSNGKRFSFFIMVIAGSAMLTSSVFMYVHNYVGKGVNLRYLQPVIRSPETGLLNAAIFFVIAYFIYAGRKYKEDDGLKQNKKLSRRERRENERRK